LDAKYFVILLQQAGSLKKQLFIFMPLHYAEPSMDEKPPQPSGTGSCKKMDLIQLLPR
jgi:hypothetical protein